MLKHNGMSSTKIMVIYYTIGPSARPTPERRQQSAGTSVPGRTEVSPIIFLHPDPVSW